MYTYITSQNVTRRWWVRPINTQRKVKGAFMSFFKEIKQTYEETFFRYTIITPTEFDKLLKLLKPRLLKRSRREFLSPEFRLAITLKFLAHGDSFQNLSWEFRIGHTTACKVILEICNAIWDVLQPQYLRTPLENDWLEISNNFWNKWNFPHTLGAIDGKHIAIQCPPNSGSHYFNYKNFFSIILLACCDADYKFLWVDIGAYGSEHDAGVFRSKMGQELDAGNINLPNENNLPGSDTKLGYFFIGDEAFPLKECIMRPYPGTNLGEKKLIFNYRLSRATRVIENAFGILTNRWRVYRSPLTCSITTSEAIIKATLCLHNYLRTEITNTYTPSTFIDREAGNGNIIEGEWRSIVENDQNLSDIGRLGSNMAARSVYNMRDHLADYLITDAGCVLWQTNYVNRGRFS